jgi:nucleoside transporter
MGASNSGSNSTGPSLTLGRYFSLAVMMFLQFAIWGSWFVVLGVYLERGLKFEAKWIGWAYSTMALGTMVTPLIIGPIADRYFSSERLMALLHIAGAGLLYLMAQITEPTTFVVTALAYALVYSPTLVLSNSITFAHVPHSSWFAWVRVWGTIGWIVVNLVVLGWILPMYFPNVDQTNKPLLLAAGCSLALGLFSFFLPHTPPAGRPGDAFPAGKAVGLLRDPSFAVFFGVSFIITIVLAFYYGFTGNFFKDDILPRLPKTVEVAGHSLALDWAPLSTLGQFSEMLLLPLLPFFLRAFGMKWVLALGMFAWGARYYLFSIGAKTGTLDPWWVVASLAFHGVCFDFFFAAGFIHVDNEAPRDIRASGQALFTFLTYGLGMFLGNVLSGYIVDHYSSGPTDAPVRNWAAIWLVPSIGVLASLVVFVLFFRPRRQAVA